MLDLIDQVVRRADAGEAVGICVVARTRGSTPQKAGAMMLVFASGQTAGTLGGGCVEAEVRVRAIELIQSGSDRMLSFRLDHDYGWDDGLVCGGVMDIAVQTIASPRHAEPWKAVAAAVARGQTARLEITVPNEHGAPVTFEHRIESRPMLILAGAGHVALALAGLAKGLEFDLTVIDDRADYACSGRFPGATCVVGEIEAELANLAAHENAYIVIVTRGHRHDGRALHAVIASKARYVGLIGSKRKILTIFKDLAAQGVPRELLQRVHAPIGLDIGAITPTEIAVSIAAELIAVRRGVDSIAVKPMKLSPAQIASTGPSEAPGLVTFSQVAAPGTVL